MLSQKSIRDKFILQLVSASATLIVIFSVILYQSIKISILESDTKALKSVASLLEKKFDFTTTKENQFINHPLLSSDFKAYMLHLPQRHKSVEFEHFVSAGQKHLSITIPLLKHEGYFLIVTKSIDKTDKILEDVIQNILLINFSAIFLILFYALFLSRMLLVPIKILTHKLTSMNEGFLKSVDITTLPDEFIPLGKSINKLIHRIQNFVKYQKELFIGTAHELKTPLAVMKTKNEVTLLKPRENERYIEALKNNIQSVNEMNAMISAILEIGRQEGAQFEEPTTFYMYDFLEKKVNDFKILAHLEKKNIKLNTTDPTCKVKIQVTLLIHILQNFVQNAIKFSPQESTITINAGLKDEIYYIEVKDEGIGIDESKDLFAPFKRYGGKGGSGLGLFLAKSASDAIGGHIELKNKTESQGTVATILLPKSCIV